MDYEQKIDAYWLTNDLISFNEPGKDTFSYMS